MIAAHRFRFHHISSRTARISRPLCIALVAGILAPVSAPLCLAQDALPPAPTEMQAGENTPAPANLVDSALKIAQSTPGARVVVVRTAAALLPRLPVPVDGDGGFNRDELSSRWLKLVMSPQISRGVRSDAFASFFDVASTTDALFARQFALQTPDAAARAGGLLQVSRAVEKSSWVQADELAMLATRAARSEPMLTPRARSLVFVAYRMSELNPAHRADAVREASSQVNLIGTSVVKDNLLLELSGAAAGFDLNLARTLANRISDEGLKNLAGARVGLSEISQTSLTKETNARIQSLATAAAPYDARALPILLRLPPQADVVKAISQTLPKIYPTARPAIETSQLEALWEYSTRLEAGVYRDQLQSRLARLMVTKDLWRGRSWGKQLSWKGGRIQVGAFLKAVLDARRSQLKAGALQETAQKNVQSAYEQAMTLPPAARAEALLLLAGQLLG